MANIDLNNLFYKKSTITSPVDSNIHLNNSEKNNIIFSDIKLDLTSKEFKSNSLNSKETNKDLNIIINEESILNSVRNIMSTTYCSRLLNPEMNFDLRTYLFESINETTAYFIGYHISTYLPLYEPRIEVENVHVIAYPKNDAYVINLRIYVPAISKNINLKSILNSEGITYN